MLFTNSIIVIYIWTLSIFNFRSFLEKIGNIIKNYFYRFTNNYYKLSLILAKTHEHKIRNAMQHLITSHGKIETTTINFNYFVTILILCVCVFFFLNQFKVRPTTKLALFCYFFCVATYKVIKKIFFGMNFEFSAKTDYIFVYWYYSQ